MAHLPGDTDDLASLLGAALDARSQQVNTCLPGVVVSYDVATQTATVRPALQRPLLTEDGEPMSERLPDLPSCPVVFPRAGGFMLHVPLSPGDSVLLLFTQWDMAEWRRQGGSHVPTGDMRHHGLGSAVVLAGLFPADMAVAGLSATEALFGTPDKMQVRLTSSHAYIGDAGLTMRKAARNTDPVRVTIPAGTVVVGVTGGGGSPAAAVMNPTDIECMGTITDGSSTVDLSD